MHIVQHGVGILDHQFLAGLQGQDLRHIEATLLIQRHRRLRGARGFSANALQRDNRVGQFAFGSNHIETGGGHLRVERPAGGVVFEHRNVFFLGRRAFQGDCPDNVACHRRLEREGQTRHCD